MRQTRANRWRKRPPARIPRKSVDVTKTSKSGQVGAAAEPMVSKCQGQTFARTALIACLRSLRVLLYL